MQIYWLWIQQFTPKEKKIVSGQGVYREVCYDHDFDLEPWSAMIMTFDLEPLSKVLAHPLSQE